MNTLDAPGAAARPRVAPIDLRPLNPFGALAEPVHVQGASRPDLRELDAGTVRGWVARHKLVVMRGFATLGAHELMAFARRFGPLLKWEFGEVLHLQVEDKPQNHLFRGGRVEMHWDGAYLTEVPPYSLFQCLHSSPTASGGETLFTHTGRVLDRLDDELRARWCEARIRYTTAKAAHYCGDVTVPLIQRHLRTGEAVIRFIEPYNEDNLDINPVQVEVEGLPQEAQEPFLREVIRRIYDPAVMLRHAWRTGDFLLYDNQALLHGRARLQGNAARRLQRIHVLEDRGSPESRPPVFIGMRRLDVHA